MKKTLLVLALCATTLFSSCSGLDAEGSYQITNELTATPLSIEPLRNGTAYEVIVYEFDEEGNSIKEVSVSDIPMSGGVSSVIAASEGATKIKVSYQFLPKRSEFYEIESNVRYYTLMYTTLIPGGLVEITLSGDSMVSTSLKSTKSMSGITAQEALESIQLK